MDSNPDLTNREIGAGPAPRITKDYPPDITMKEYRDLWKADQVVQVAEYKRTDIEDLKMVSVLELWPSINMQRMQGKTDHEIASAIERHYVGAH